MKQPLITGVIPYADYAKSSPIQKMVEEILSGRKNRYTRKEVEHIVDQRYFGFDSLVSLTETEESSLRNAMVNDLLYQFNEGTVSEFLKSVCYQGVLRDEEKFLNVYTNDASERDSNSSKISLMSKKQKLSLLKNPENLNVRLHNHVGSCGFAMMGYRDFDQYSISHEFTKVIQELQVINNRQELCVLDLGGGVARALKDIKEIHPELITYNATRDEEFAHYPADFHVIGFMERMPLVLKEKIDFIFSNMATRYFAYSDLVIQCCVSMLAKNGIMNVFFSSERSENQDREDVRRRMKKAYDFLRDLEQSELIKLEIGSSFTSILGGSFKSEKESLYPAANVFVQKL